MRSRNSTNSGTSKLQSCQIFPKLHARKRTPQIGNAILPLNSCRTSCSTSPPIFSEPCTLTEWAHGLFAKACFNNTYRQLIGWWRSCTLDLGKPFLRDAHQSNQTGFSDRCAGCHHVGESDDKGRSENRGATCRRRPSSMGKVSEAFLQYLICDSGILSGMLSSKSIPI